MKSEVTNNLSSPAVAAEEPQPAAATPEQVIESLRAVRASIPPVTPLSTQERARVRNNVKVSHDVLQAQINVIDMSDKVESALGHAPDEVRGIAAEHDRWIAVETELKSLLASVSSANLIRGQKLQLIGAQAYVIGASLARSEENGDLAGHVEEVRRLKRIAKRKKASPASPAPAGSGQPGT